MRQRNGQDREPAIEVLVRRGAGSGDIDRIERRLDDALMLPDRRLVRGRTGPEVMAKFST